MLLNFLVIYQEPIARKKGKRTKCCRLAEGSPCIPTSKAQVVIIDKVYFFLQIILTLKPRIYFPSESHRRVEPAFQIAA